MPLYDMDIMKGVKQNGAANRVTFDFSSKVIYGTQKAVQRFVICLLTRLGSVKADPTFGTNLYTDLRSVNVSNEAELRSIFDGAFQSTLARETEQVQAGTIDENESVSAYQILEFNLTADSISVEVALTIGDNTQTITLPISLNG